MENNEHLTEREVRLQKLEKIREERIDPYPAHVSRTHAIDKALADFDVLAVKKEKVSLAGRVRSIRLHGGSCFSHIEDVTGRIQVYFKKDEVGEEAYGLLKEAVDMGDFVSVMGTLFQTNRGERTLMAEKFDIVGKALLPLPDKHSGLANTEIRYRQRYLDLLANPKSREVFEARSLIVRAVRDFFHGRDYLEVETPVLQPLYGGALAKPFITHHNMMDADMYLRIAPELYLKRLLVGGFDRVFELARCFRNEGIDWAHNPEFTQVEFYQAYASYEDLMKLTEDLLAFILDRLGKGTELEYRGKKIDFKGPYPRLTFRDALKQYANIDIEEYRDRSALAKKAEELGLEIDDNMGRGKILDELYKQTARFKIVQPTFVTDDPIELSPLAKKTAYNPNYTERFHLVLGEGIELCNAYSELNDPIEQRRQFEEQAKLAEAGDEESMAMDEDFITALEHGMPPAAGEGIGIDRLVSVLTDSPNLKEVILFPTMKMKSHNMEYGTHSTEEGEEDGPVVLKEKDGGNR